MSRPVTVKNIKEHFECACGLNSVEDYQEKLRVKDLKGFKKRRYRDTGERFYFIHIKAEECHCYDE
ncbi:MAG: hypothetical protein ACTHMM_05600 [Agriterribacter sp.]